MSVSFPLDFFEIVKETIFTTNKHFWVEKYKKYFQMLKFFRMSNFFKKQNKTKLKKLKTKKKIK